MEYKELKEGKRGEKKESKVSVEDIESVKQLFNLYQAEWNKSIHSMKLTDDVCLQLLNCYFEPECNVIAQSLLHVCVHSPPCSENEKELTTNGRKWCKGRNIKYKSEEFDKNAMIMHALYEQAEKRKEKMKPSLKNEITGEIGKLTDLDLELRLEKLSVSEKKEMVKGEDIDMKTLEKRLDKLYTSQDKKHILKEVKSISEKLQEKKVKNKIESEVITITRKSEKKVYEELKQETKDVNIDNTLNKMQEIFESLDDRLKSIEQQTLSIDSKQDKVIQLAETINARQELQTYIDTWYKSKYGLAKKIVLAPLKALNIIILRPARYAFWHFFGKYFYLIWGLLMLILIIACCLTAYSYLKIYVPTYFNLMSESIIYLWGASIRSGNTLAQFISPVIKESLHVLYNSASTFLVHITNSVANYLYELMMWVIGLVSNILTKSITEKLSLW